MGVLLRLSLLIMGVSCRSIVANERVGNYDRIITVCSEDRMEIHLRKDLEAGFSLKGEEPECEPVNGTFTDYDGKIVTVKTWSLPLKEGTCGLRYGPQDDSELLMYSTTMYGPDKLRTVSCTRTGVLDKRGAIIRVEQITPHFHEFHSNEGTVEVLKGSTISAFFHHRFPEAAAISLHPIQCWLINEKRNTKRLVIEDGCPVKNNAGNQTIVSLGSESADESTGDHPHVFFNAEPILFEDEDSHSFRLQCTVMPCKGLSLHQQLIGVARCPAISQCQYNRKMVAKPTGTFEINQEFSLSIASCSVSPSVYRPLPGPIYPGQYWMSDMRARANPNKTEYIHPSCDWFMPYGVMGLLVFIVFAIFSYYQWTKTQSLKVFLRKRIAAAQSTIDVVYPEKQSAAPIFEDYDSVPLQQVD